MSCSYPYGTILRLSRWWVDGVRGGVACREFLKVSDNSRPKFPITSLLEKHFVVSCLKLSSRSPYILLCEPSHFPFERIPARKKKKDLWHATKRWRFRTRKLRTRHPSWNDLRGTHQLCPSNPPLFFLILFTLSFVLSSPVKIIHKRSEAYLRLQWEFTLHDIRKQVFDDPFH